MLARKNRFHGRTSLSYVYRQGSTVRAQHLGLRYIKNSRNTDYRVAVIVSRKVHKSAVARNRLRRRIYEIVRTGPAIAEPFDLVFTVFSERASELESKELTDTIHKLLIKANIYNHIKQSNSQAHAIVKTGKS